ncbi:MAG: PAS domain-containing protein [Pseudomonadota bacterium]|nr:PAS domain-containing protein [Pseudomonadota bacterium]
MPIETAAYDALPLQVWTARVDGSLDYVNSSVTGYFCVSASRLLEKGWMDFCHPQDLSEAARRWSHSLRTGEPYEMVFRLLGGVDRKYRWHVARASPLRDGDDAIVGWVGSNIEVDMLKRSEELGQAWAVRAQMARERFHLLLAKAPVAITVTHGPEHRVELSNQRARAIIGGRNTEGLLLTEAFPELEAQGIIDKLDRVYRSGERLEEHEMPVRFDRLGDGQFQQAWFDTTLEPLRDADGEVSGIMIVSVELTASVRARADVDRLLRERAAVLDQLAEGVIITDHEGRISFVNQAAEQLHGCALLDVPPERYADAYHLFTEQGEPYPPHELPLARAILGDETVRDARWQIRRADGSVVIAQGSAQPLRGQDGEKIGAVLTVREAPAG